MPASPTLRRVSFLALGLLALPGSIASYAQENLPAPPESGSTDAGFLPPADATPPEADVPSLAPAPAPEPEALAPAPAPAPMPTDPAAPPPEEKPVEKAEEPTPKPTEAAKDATPAKPAEKATTTAAEPKATPKVDPKKDTPTAEATPSPTPTPTPTAEIPLPEPTPLAMPEPEATPTPEATQAAAPSDSGTPENTGSSRHHGMVPEYQKTRPQWAVQLEVSPSALGSDDISTDFTGHPLAYNIHFEFQPAFLQSIGVIGFGPTIGLYSFPQDQNIASTTGVWSVGIEGRYQARFFREQWVVPVVGYAAERINYHFQTGSQPSGSLIGSGPIFGLWLLLNEFEPGTAEEMYKQNGVSRSYFIAEARDLEGSDDYLSFSGFSFFFGLRIEF